MSRRISKAEYLLELLFPPRCIFCGEIIPIGADCCEACADDFSALRLSGEDLTHDSGRALSTLDGACACFHYERPASDAVARYKFRGERSLAGEFAKFMADDFRRAFPYAGCSIALGVPSYERRSDHAVLLARRCAKLLGIRFYADLLIKARATQKQHELAAAERATNLAGAFAVLKPALVSGQAILLVDDVTTSGETMGECAKALKAAGAKRVYALALCATEKKL